MTNERLSDTLIRVATDLQALKVPWALVGGLAVSAWTEPRTTRDVDVAVAVESDEDGEAVVRSMVARGYRIVQPLDQGPQGRLWGVRLMVAGRPEHVLVDLLFASCGIEAEVAAEAEPYEILAGLVVPLARVGHLLAMKVLALDYDNPQARPQDLADIRELLRVADHTEIRRARDSLSLISRRGFDRDKDLSADFDNQLRLFSELKSRHQS